MKTYLDTLARRFESAAFVADDPVSVPHAWRARAEAAPTRLGRADVEIAAFVAATFAWGRRATILGKSREFLARMGDSPHAFVLGYGPGDRARFDDFAHRTFQPADADYVLSRLRDHYRASPSLETMFLPDPGSPPHPGPSPESASPPESEAPPDRCVERALTRFHDRFFDRADAPARTRKHVATPARGSTCKRLCMLLRWMVRSPAGGVDFGWWRGLTPAQLVIPLDVHVGRTSRALGLLTREQSDWRAARELTDVLRGFDPEDPLRYDFALFGYGVNAA